VKNNPRLEDLKPGMKLVHSVGNKINGKTKDTSRLQFFECEVIEVQTVNVKVKFRGGATKTVAPWSLWLNH
jgi:hypothetical protein